MTCRNIVTLLTGHSLLAPRWNTPLRGCPLSSLPVFTTAITSDQPHVPRPSGNGKPQSRRTWYFQRGWFLFGPLLGRSAGTPHASEPSARRHGPEHPTPRPASASASEANLSSTNSHSLQRRWLHNGLVDNPCTSRRRSRWTCRPRAEVFVRRAAVLRFSRDRKC